MKKEREISDDPFLSFGSFLYRTDLLTWRRLQTSIRNSVELCRKHSATRFVLTLTHIKRIKYIYNNYDEALEKFYQALNVITR